MSLKIDHGVADFSKLLLEEPARPRDVFWPREPDVPILPAIERLQEAFKYPQQIGTRSRRSRMVFGSPFDGAYLALFRDTPNMLLHLSPAWDATPSTPITLVVPWEVDFAEVAKRLHWLPNTTLIHGDPLTKTLIEELVNVQLARRSLEHVGTYLKDLSIRRGYTYREEPT